MNKVELFTGFGCIILKIKGKWKGGGNNNNGNLGIGNIESQSSLKEIFVPKNEEIEQIAVSSTHTLFLMKSGKIFGCGDGKRGCLANWGNAIRPKMQQLKFFQNYKAKSVHTGVMRSCVILEENNAVYEFGFQIKNPFRLDLTFMKDKREFAKDIKLGSNHLLLLSSTGKVYSKGNGKLACGHGDNVRRSNFTLIQFFKSNEIKIQQIQAGGSHSLFLTTDNLVYSCGANQYGQLGLGKVSSRNIPQKINLKNIKTIKTGLFCSFFITQNNQIYCSGFNLCYNLGLGHSIHIFEPTMIISVNKFMDVFPAGNTTYFLKENGELFSCGRNINGSCILGNTDTPIKEPTKIKDLKLFSSGKDVQNLIHKCKNYFDLSIKFKE